MWKWPFAVFTEHNWYFCTLFSSVKCSNMCAVEAPVLDLDYQFTHACSFNSQNVKLFLLHLVKMNRKKLNFKGVLGTSRLNLPHTHPLPWHDESRYCVTGRRTSTVFSANVLSPRAVEKPPPNVAWPVGVSVVHKSYFLFCFLKVWMCV